jgi:hypothetical protein
MFQNYGLLSIIFSFLISFIDEIGEMGEISSKKVFLITVAFVMAFLFYKLKVQNKKIKMKKR